MRVLSKLHLRKDFTCCNVIVVAEVGLSLSGSLSPYRASELHPHWCWMPNLYSSLLFFHLTTPALFPALWLFGLLWLLPGVAQRDLISIEGNLFWDLIGWQLVTFWLECYVNLCVYVGLEWTTVFFFFACERLLGVTFCGLPLSGFLDVEIYTASPSLSSSLSPILPPFLPSFPPPSLL